MLTVTLAAGRPVRLSLVPTRMNAAFQPQPGEEQVWEAADLAGPDRVLD
jgi:hypothetical protein